MRAGMCVIIADQYESVLQQEWRARYYSCSELPSANSLFKIHFYRMNQAVRVSGNEWTFIVKISFKIKFLN